MRQIWISKAGKPEVLEVRTTDDPVPAPDEILIDVKASGINFAEIMARLGTYPDAPQIPCVVGYEVAGVVETTGAHVEGIEVGSKVIGLIRFQGYSSKITLPMTQVYPLPEDWSFEEGAGFPVTYLTAYQLLIVMGNIRESQRVLIHNAGGGVGTAATQIAKLFGVEIFGTASADKHDYLMGNGVDHPIDYRNRDFVRRIHDLTNGEGVDLIVDSIGGKHFARSYNVLRPTGRLVMFGVSAMVQGKSRSYLDVAKMLLGTPLMKFHPINLMNQNKGVLGVNIGHLWEEVEMISGWLRKLLEWANSGQIRPVIDRVFSFEEAATAHHYIQDRRNKGKVILRP